MFWKPTKLWDNETAVIIGGGPSLKTFPWHLLAAKAKSGAVRVLGCNDAYLLGDWVDICYFGDLDWYNKHQRDLNRFKGLVVSCCPRPLNGDNKPYFLPYPVHMLERDMVDEFHVEGPSVGWFGNTGASAVNFACQLGVRKIVLLGFDMKLDADGSANWHPNLITPATNEVYPYFMTGFKLCAAGVAKHFPDVKVVNATPGTVMETFPVVGWKEVLL